MLVRNVYDDVPHLQLRQFLIGFRSRSIKHLNFINPMDFQFRAPCRNSQFHRISCWKFKQDFGEMSINGWKRLKNGNNVSLDFRYEAR